MIKEKSNEFEKRILRTIACPQNKYIPRVENAGEIIGDYQIMHNGLKVQVDGYYGEYKSNGRGFITDMLLRNRGVHEPQEERMFMEVLNDIPAGGVMLELGSYWAFYSMWFYQKVKDAKCYMIEPDSRNLQVGINNFAINDFTGDFSIGGIPEVKVDKWMEDKCYLDILHADTQGYELNMLQDAEKSLRENKIKYVFVSGHSQELHNDCVDFLKKCGYEILGVADFDNESNCLDSIIVARNKTMPGIANIDINEEMKLLW